MAVATIGNELDVVRASAPFRQMTEPMQRWVVHFLTNGNLHEATKFAYPNASAASQYSMSYQLKSNDSVQQCLEVFRWASSAQSRLSLIALVKSQLEAAAPGSVSAQRLCSQLQSLTLGEDQESDAQNEPISEAPKPIVANIGDVVLQDGQKFRVTAVDENGHPTDGEPV